MLTAYWTEGRQDKEGRWKLKSVRSLYTVEIFEWRHARTVEYKWRIRHRNGSIIAIASEHYKNKKDMVKVMRRCLAGLMAGKFTVRDKTTEDVLVRGSGRHGQRR